jgi:dTDP-4-dehydrorhamnose 3,5-epimerase
MGNEFYISQASPIIPADNAILGVEIKQLKTFADDRGFFREVLRCTDSVFEAGRFGQWSHSRMTKHVVKAWHYHHIQTDWWYVPIGQVETVLYDNREESPTYKTKLCFKMGDSRIYGPDTFEVCVRIPTGVLHGCRVLSDEAHLFYVTSETYNPQDEGRIPFNSESVPHDWGQEALTVENDRRFYKPAKERVKIASKKACLTPA